jgi:hypothetical protein
MAIAKPQDFLIGVRDFFAVLVPGATFLFLLPQPVRAAAGIDGGGTQLVAFAIAAYLAGSVASAIGSALDFIVDPCIDENRSFGSKKLRARRDLAGDLRAEFIRACPCDIAADKHPETIKSFWWNHLRLHSPPAMVELDRIEATQKLFRSLVAVFSVLALLAAFGSMVLPASLSGSQFPLPAAAAVSVAVLSAGFYASGRIYFLASVYRFAGAYCIPERGPTEPKGRT